MSDVHEARVEAAAAATWAIDDFTPWSEVDEVQREIFREDARIALAAADAVVTEAAIGRAIMGRTAPAGAKAVMKILRGETDDE